MSLKGGESSSNSQDTDERGSGDNFKKGLWTPEEDAILSTCVQRFKEGNWSTIALRSGLTRSGKSCRLRWVKHLSPAVKNGPLTEKEQRRVIELQLVHGNKWALMASLLPGRSDNTIKNFWNSHRKRALRRAQAQQHQHLLPAPRGAAACSRGRLPAVSRDAKEDMVQPPVGDHDHSMPAPACVPMSEDDLGLPFVSFSSTSCDEELSSGFLPAAPEASHDSDCSIGIGHGGAHQLAFPLGFASLAKCHATTSATSHADHYSPFEHDEKSPTMRISGENELEEEMAERRRLRHLAEARKVWELIGASPTGMREALRECMPAALKTSAVSACCAEATVGSSGDAHLLLPPGLHALGASGAHPGQAQEGEGDDERQDEAGEYDWLALQADPTCPAAPCDSDPHHTDHVLAPAEESPAKSVIVRTGESGTAVAKRARQRLHTPSMPMSVDVPRLPFMFPEAGCPTPADVLFARSQQSPSLAALLASPRYDWAWGPGRNLFSPPPLGMH